MNEWFRKFSQRVSVILGSSWVFIVALLIIILWAISGPMFGFSETWQLVINTGTTIVTFLMVFVLQNSQMRESQAIHAKLDEIIHSLDEADNSFMNLENASEEKLKQAVEELRKRNG